jgi:serine/threonine protein phosphatase PrpC
MLCAAGCSDRGVVRRTNEDSFFESEDIGLLIVADGMGGHAAGEVAAQLAVEAVTGFIRQSHEDDEHSWPYGVDPQLSLDANRLRTAVHLANRRVFRAAEIHDDYTGMGTTIVAALATDDHLAIAHVGDSRLYLLTAEGLAQITRDDSWAATVLGQSADAGVADMSHHPMRNVLTNVLGAGERAEVHVQERRLSAGDWLLLCSDGLHGSLDDAAILSIFQQHRTPAAAASAFVQNAIEHGSRDNITALVAVCEEQ